MSLYGFDDFDDSEKLTLLNEAYYDISTREPWPYLEKQVKITVPDGEDLITNNSLVTDTITGESLSIDDLDSVLSLIDVSNRVVMVPERLDVIEKNYVVNNLNVFPERYYFVNEAMRLYPVTRGATNYILTYIATPVALPASTDTNITAPFLVPARHHSVILYGALVKAFLVNDDPQAAAFQNMFEQRYQQMRNNLWLNQYDRTDRVHVLTDSYDWGY
jgi:hypothetical protein